MGEVGRFLYHIPNRSKVDRKELCELRLDDVLPNPCQRPGSPGPDGSTGLLLVQGEGQARYDADNQAWFVHNGVAVGMVKDDPPRPADLAREQMLAGEPVRLGDGQDWIIPVALRFPGNPAFPRQIVLNNGKWCAGDVVGRHAALWDMAWRVFMAYVRAPETDNQVKIDDPVDIAVELLRANYRVRGPELSLLGVLTTENLWQDIFETAISWAEHVEREEELVPSKKNEAESAAGDEPKVTCG